MAPKWAKDAPRIPPRTSFGRNLAHWGSHFEDFWVAPGVVWGHCREQIFCMKLCSPVAKESPARPFPPAPPGLGILLEGRPVGDTSADQPASNPSSTTLPAFPPQRAPRSGGSATWILLCPQIAPKRWSPGSAAQAVRPLNKQPKVNKHHSKSSKLEMSK